MEPQIKGLQKLVNSDIIKNIYPMVDRIKIDFSYPKTRFTDKFIMLDTQIYLNNPKITKENMYEMGFDPHYLVDYHIRNLLPYLNIENVITINFEVYSPDGTRIMYYSL